MNNCVPDWASFPVPKFDAFGPPAPFAGCPGTAGSLPCCVSHLQSGAWFQSHICWGMWKAAAAHTKRQKKPRSSCSGQSWWAASWKSLVNYTRIHPSKIQAVIFKNSSFHWLPHLGAVSRYMEKEQETQMGLKHGEMLPQEDTPDCSVDFGFIVKVC